jgi:cell fate regulator YaaT (PSP1 superfamily)
VNETSEVEPDSELQFIRQSAQELNLEMTPVKIEFLGEDVEKKFFVYFTANKRIDFRELVKRLAKKHRCRIEMRQITSRQYASMLGGINVCGNMPCFRPWCHKSKWGGCFYDKVEDRNCKDCKEQTT